MAVVRRPWDRLWLDCHAWSVWTSGNSPGYLGSASMTALAPLCKSMRYLDLVLIIRSCYDHKRLGGVGTPTLATLLRAYLL